MKKLILTLMALLTMVSGASASTTLWEGTEDGNDINIAKEKLVAGATITLEFNWEKDGAAKFSCFYWKENDWTYLKNYQWVNHGETYSFSLTQEQIDDIPSVLGFKHVELDNTIKKISIEATPVTEWEGTDDGSDIFIAKSKLIAGAPITLEFNWLGNDGAQFSSFYWDGSTWQKIRDYQWVNNGNTSYTFWLTQTQIDAIPEQLGFKTEDKNKMTIKKISIFKPCVSVTIGSDGIATFSSAKKLDFSGTGVTPYYASAVATGTVTLTAAENATTWDFLGYILQGPEGTYDVPVTTKATYYDTNYLKAQVGEGTVSASTNGSYHYILAKHNSDIGFYKLTADHTLAAHKAYLETKTDITPTGGNNARAILVFGDDHEATSIHSLQEPEAVQPVYYTLSGQRVEHPSKGLYILKGKKVVIR